MDTVYIRVLYGKYRGARGYISNSDQPLAKGKFKCFLYLKGSKEKRLIVLSEISFQRIEPSKYFDQNCIAKSFEKALADSLRGKTYAR